MRKAFKRRLNIFDAGAVKPAWGDIMDRTDVLSEETHDGHATCALAPDEPDLSSDDDGGECSSEEDDENKNKILSRESNRSSSSDTSSASSTSEESSTDDRDAEAVIELSKIHDRLVKKGWGMKC